MRLPRDSVRYWVLCLFLASTSHTDDSSSIVDAFAPVATRNVRVVHRSCHVAVFMARQSNNLEDDPKIPSGSEDVRSALAVNDPSPSPLPRIRDQLRIFLNEADRRIEESMARIMGEDPSYTRPMDTGEEKIGPLGRAEQNVFEWLSRVIEEEERRAEKIANSDGEMVRPIDLASGDDNEMGPLASLEKAAMDFLKRIRDQLRNFLQRLAELSLEDYKWRSSVFKTNEADRRVEESVARMMGEDPSYVRPMDAGDEKIGPLGRAEKKAVEWLSQVIEEEARRAEKIANSEGELVRPIDLASEDDNEEDMGPLALLEKAAVDFLNSIKDSERERASTATLRPMDLDESKRGPLGDAEAKAVAALREIQESETLRMQQSRLRGGEVVRPIDVPGPLGEFEKTVADIIGAEQQRVKDREVNEGRLVRPKDATVKGPLGKAEKQALNAVERLQEEERERLRNIQRTLEEKRPMESDRTSPLGITEAFTVGLLRGPKLFMSVVERVKELMQSEKLDDDDEELVNEQMQLPESSSQNEADPFQ